MKESAKENKKRITLFLLAAIVFVVSATLVLVGGIAMFNLASLHVSATSSMEYGYDVYYIHGAEVHPQEYYSKLEDYNIMVEMNEEEEEPIPFEDWEAQEGLKVEHVDADFTFNEELYSDYMGKLWITVITAGILMVISLIVGCIYSGKKKEDGTIAVNFFDRVFLEIQIVLAALSLVGCYVVFVLLDSWFLSSDTVRNIVSDLFNNYSKVWDLLSWYSFEEYHGVYWANFLQPSWVLLLLAFIGGGLVFTLLYLVITSVVKKLKARCLLRYTIPGALASGVSKTMANSKNLRLKVYGGIIGFAFLVALDVALVLLSLLEGSEFISILAMLAGGALLVVVLRLATKQIKKFEALREGVEEVQGGNFSYKIPAIEEGELGRLAKSINAIRDAQEEAIRNELKSERLRSELISNVSHDLRTPLTSIMSYVDLLKKEGLDSPQGEEYLNIIQEKTNRLHQLTDDLFEAAKASSGDLPLNIETIDLDAMARQAIAEMEENLSQNNIEIIYNCKAEESEVLADGNLLWRVIENLFTNVGKYALPNTRAYVDIMDKGERLELSVKNTSNAPLNISKEELMERFQRGDASRNTDGSGLGLAIANDLTELMKGHFDIYIDGDLFKATLDLAKP